MVEGKSLCEAAFSSNLHCNCTTVKSRSSPAIVTFSASWQCPLNVNMQSSPEHNSPPVLPVFLCVFIFYFLSLTLSANLFETEVDCSQRRWEKEDRLEVLLKAEEVSETMRPITLSGHLSEQ